MLISSDWKKGSDNDNSFRLKKNTNNGNSTSIRLKKSANNGNINSMTLKKFNGIEKKLIQLYFKTLQIMAMLIPFDLKICK